MSRRKHFQPSSLESLARGSRTSTLVALGAVALVCWAWHAPVRVQAIGERTVFDVRSVRYAGGGDTPRPTAARRLAWEVRKRTSIETRLEPSAVRLDNADIFASPFLYWSGDRGFPSLSDAESAGLRRFVEYGGFVLIDDAAPDTDAFDSAVRRELERAFPDTPLARLPSDHTIYRAFYLLERPVGRVEGPGHLEVIAREGRAAVVYARQDLGGAWARSNIGHWSHSVTPGGDLQRERAYRLGVNLVMYALCLDYKDDQVHAPFIMRRRGRTP